MSRPNSSSIYYPIIPPASPSDNALVDVVKGVKDAVFNIYTKGVSAAYSGDKKHSVSLVRTHNDNINNSVGMDFEAVIYGEDESYTTTVSFEITKGEGLGSVASNDGNSFLFIDMTELSSSLSEESYDRDLYVVEPCCVRWNYASVTDITLVNEERISEIGERDSLRNEVVATFTDRLQLYNGYNVSLYGDEGLMSIQGNPGEGRGLAPYNPWEDKNPPDHEHVILSINGQPPDAKGSIKIETSSSVSLSVEGNLLLISDNSHKGG